MAMPFLKKSSSGKSVTVKRPKTAKNRPATGMKRRMDEKAPAYLKKASSGKVAMLAKNAKKRIGVK